MGLKKNNPGCGCCGCSPISEVKRVRVEISGDHLNYSKEWEPWENKGTSAGLSSRDRSKTYWYNDTEYRQEILGVSYDICKYYLYPDQQKYTGIPANNDVGDDTAADLWAMEADVVTAGQTGTRDIKLTGFFNSVPKPCNYTEDTSLQLNYYLANIVEFYVLLVVFKRVDNGVKTYSLSASAAITQVIVTNYNSTVVVFTNSTGITTTYNNTGRTLSSANIPVGPNQASVIGAAGASPNFGNNFCFVTTRHISPKLGADYQVTRNQPTSNIDSPLIQNAHTTPIQSNSLVYVTGRATPPDPDAYIAFPATCAINAPSAPTVADCGCSGVTAVMPPTDLPWLYEKDPFSPATPNPAVCNTLFTGIGNAHSVVVESFDT
jgi:hypothetical protein